MISDKIDSVYVDVLTNCYGRLSTLFDCVHRDKNIDDFAAINDIINTKNDINEAIFIIKNIVTDKDKIVEMFCRNVKRKKYYPNTKTKHDGQEGHWLEARMGVKFNSDNKPDLYGYEMKKYSKKISFGDWSANEYLFSGKRTELVKLNGTDICISKYDFMKNFGNRNSKYINRHSWSGKCIPRYGQWNKCGQKLDIDDNSNITANYCYEYDERNIDIDERFKIGKICIAVWYGTSMKQHVDSKFNQNGFFVCKKNKNGEYDKLGFGPRIDFKMFVENVKTNNIIFDSGMYHDTLNPNTRLYQQWRATNKFFDELIIEEY